MYLRREEGLGSVYWIKNPVTGACGTFAAGVPCPSCGGRGCGACRFPRAPGCSRPLTPCPTAYSSRAIGVHGLGDVLPLPAKDPATLRKNVAMILSGLIEMVAPPNETRYETPVIAAQTNALIDRIVARIQRRQTPAITLAELRWVYESYSGRRGGRDTSTTLPVPAIAGLGVRTVGDVGGCYWRGVQYCARTNPPGSQAYQNCVNNTDAYCAANTQALR